jgi:LacI family transcriptional regulator
MAATIKDVARLAGVSPSTVSRVLNQKGVISDETKQKIASAMEQLKYVPNDIARSFANGSAHAISLVIDISDGTAYANNFFNNTVFGIETAAHQNDYNLIITNGAEAFGGAPKAHSCCFQAYQFPPSSGCLPGKRSTAWCCRSRS